jgi:hypothetical protein
MRYDDDCALLRVIEARHDLTVKQQLDSFEAVHIVAVFDLDGVVNDDEMGSDTGDAALDRDRADTPAGAGCKVVELAPIGRDACAKGCDEC